jgi:multidrug efflux pump subunit AcrA (membrane-fusion protein)
MIKLKYFMVFSLRKLVSYLFVLLVVLFINCETSKKSSETITFRVQRGVFTNSLFVNGQLKAKKSVTISCPDVWPAPKIKKLVPEGTFVQTNDVVCELEAGELASRHGEAVSGLENARAEMLQTRAELQLQRTLLTAQVQSIEAATQIANLQLPRMNYVSPINREIIRLEIERAEVEKTKILNKLAALELIQTSELKKMEMKIKQAENQVSRTQMFLDWLILRAPQAGLIVYQNHWATGNKISEGENVWGGMPLLQIPEVATLQVEIAASEANIKKIQKDQSVRIKVDARPGVQLSGKVARVAKMGKAINQESKIKTFEVVVDVDSSDFEVQPGLSATCEIMIETIADTLLVPGICLFQKDSTQFVYCQAGKWFRKTFVEVGLQSENFSIITKGLHPGEIVALAQPPEHRVKQ